MNQPEQAVISVRPVVLPVPGRGDDLQVRVTAPMVGDQMPVIVFSHGFAHSLDDYAPLVDYWSSHGFAVIQPTHLDSTTLNITPDDHRYADIWRFRVEDLKHIADQLDVIEAAVPGLPGRLDRSRIAVAGHSWGAQSASMLLGARALDATDMTDPRFKAGVLLALAGLGGDNLTPFAAENFSFMNPDFTSMAAPALIVAGDKDQSALSLRGPEWFTEGYFQSPAPKSLLTLLGAEHSLGGIPGYHSTETTDENPDQVALIQRLSVSYLRSVFYSENGNWVDSESPLARLESK